MSQMTEASEALASLKKPFVVTAATRPFVKALTATVPSWLWMFCGINLSRVVNLFGYC